MVNTLEIMQEVINEDVEIMKQVIQEDLIPLIEYRAKMEKELFNKSYKELKELEQEV